LEFTREYDFTDERMHSLLNGLSAAEQEQFNGSIVSAFLRAKKPEK
jgi:hypothetical protein